MSRGIPSRLIFSGLALLLALAGGEVRAQDASLKTFPTYRAAAAAFVAASDANDDAALADMLGPKAKELLSSGDPTQDQNERRSFVQQYNVRHSFVRDAPGKVKLSVGNSEWLLPFPIVRADGAWHFDVEAGAEELVYRRIGQNELEIAVAVSIRHHVGGAEKRLPLAIARWVTGRVGKELDAELSIWVAVEGAVDGGVDSVRSGRSEHGEVLRVIGTDIHVAVVIRRNANWIQVNAQTGV